MIYSYAGNRCLHLGCAAVVATALTVGVVAPQPFGRSVVSVESHLVSVGVEVALASVVVNTPSAAVAAPPSGVVWAATTANAGALGLTIDPQNPLVQFLNFLVLPLWYLAFPITLPMTWNAAIQHFGAGLDFMLPVAVFLDFLGGPLGVYNLLNPPATTTTAAARSAASKSETTDATSPVNSAASSLRRNSVARDSISRRARLTPAAASKRSARSAAASQSSDASKPASAASKRKSVG